MTGTIRFAVKADIADMSDIDSLVSTLPWSLAQFLTACEPAGAAERALVIETSTGTAGFVVYHAVLDEGSIYNIAVAPGQQRRGYAQQLLLAAMANMVELGVLRCLLEVRESNIAARNLYDSFGFHLDGVRSNYYRNGDQREDALLMSKLL
ncbi:MAG: ribosomal protein S18-alanine N-acetyltransferase [Halioglobus sp.]